MGDVGERRRRRELEHAREQAAVVPDVTAGASVVDDGAPGEGSREDGPQGGSPASDGAAGVPLPLSRRDLRERDRRLGARATAGTVRPGVPAQRDGASAGAAVSPPTVPAPVAADALGAAATPAGGPPAAGLRPQAPELASGPQRYRWWHLLVLAAVAGVLASLIWTLTTGAADPGATSAARPATHSLPGSPAAPLGEL